MICPKPFPPRVWIDVEELCEVDSYDQLHSFTFDRRPPKYPQYDIANEYISIKESNHLIKLAKIEMIKWAQIAFMDCATIPPVTIGELKYSQEAAFIHMLSAKLREESEGE